ncbi:MAG: hypothetical protein L3J24_03185 [Xanthomonadales bacterium]|nr:hypothetical protein [Xanthomonadales bacterium]
MAVFNQIVVVRVTGPNIVSPDFDSDLGRGGTYLLGTLIDLPTLPLLDFNIRNDATAVGFADPLTRLTLNTIDDSSPEGSISINNFSPGLLLDEGESVDIEFEFAPARLGYITLGINVDTDEGADLGQQGLEFQFEFKAHADGGNVAASLLADRPSIAAGDTMVVWLDASNPGNTAGSNNQLGLLLPLNTSCNWTAMPEKGAVGNASNLSNIANDLVSLPARSRVLYRGGCFTEAGALPRQMLYHGYCYESDGLIYQYSARCLRRRSIRGRQLYCHNCCSGNPTANYEQCRIKFVCFFQNGFFTAR